MNKKLFILMFLIISSPVLAEDSRYTDIYVDEQPPSETIQSTDIQTEKKTWAHNFQLFNRNPKIKKAKEVDVVKPPKKSSKNFFKRTKTAVNNVEEIQPIENIEPVLQDIDTTIVPVVNRTEENIPVEETAAANSSLSDKIIEVDDCVKLALENHPAIKSAMSNADIYKSRIAQAWANYFPTFSAGISYSRNNAQETTAHIPVQNFDMYYVPNVSGNMLLFDFGKTKALADIAKRSHESAEYTAQNTINTVIFIVKQAYYNLLFAKQQVKVYESTVNDYELHLKQAQAYYEIGTKPKIDVLTAEYNLGKAKLGLIQAKNTLKIAYVQLSNAMGLPEYSDYEVIDNLHSQSYDIGIDDAVNTAYETSPELLAAKKKADASELLVRASKRAFTPDLSGFAGYTRGGRHMDTDSGYQIGAQLNYSTVNLLLLKKQVDEAKATHKKELSDYENIRQNIYLEVKQAYLNMVTAQESVSVSQLSMNQAKEQYDQASGRYKVGLGDAIELKDAETTYRNAQLDFYNSLLNYHVSAAHLEKLMGTPMEKSDNELL